MRYNRYDAIDDEFEIEDLRKRLIEQLESAYFSGIGPAAVEIVDAKRADKDELLRLARKWGVW